MLSCKDIAEHAGDIHDRQLPWAKRLAVRVHLMMCIACRQFMRHYAVAAKLGARQLEKRYRKANPDAALKQLDDSH